MAEGALRLFVAVPVPPSALDAFRHLLDAARAGDGGRAARWVRTENLHLTLRFLGATSPSLVPAVTDALTAVATGTRPFDVNLMGVGSFPPDRRPRALWIGIRQGADELAAIAVGLEAGLVPLGWSPEKRPFRPHLTVARTDAASSVDALAAAEGLRAAAVGWHTAFRAQQLVLYRSLLGGGPPRYEALETLALRG